MATSSVNPYSMPPARILEFPASPPPKTPWCSPVESAILAGELETRVSLMQIVPKMDAGYVLDLEKVPITPEDTSPLPTRKTLPSLPTFDFQEHPNPARRFPLPDPPRRLRRHLLHQIK